MGQMTFKIKRKVQKEILINKYDFNMNNSIKIWTMFESSQKNYA